MPRVSDVPAFNNPRPGRGAGGTPGAARGGPRVPGQQKNLSRGVNFNLIILILIDILY